MDAIAEQLGLDKSFFVQFFIFALFFWVLSKVYFKPFLKLFELRHKRTVEDKEAAEKLMVQAQAKLEEYQKCLNQERLNARKEYEVILMEAKKEESSLLAQAREEAKKTTQNTLESIGSQRENIKKEIERDIETLAQKVTETFLKTG